jgi:drug/metabolite transporter (DMT)-like permease
VENQPSVSGKAKANNRMPSNPSTRGLKPGITAALVSAVLFGAGAPLAKYLLDGLSPWMLAGLLYLGSGIGLASYRFITIGRKAALCPQLNVGDWKWLTAAIICGGGIAPVLLMWGLSGMPASRASLLLNAEAVLTALLAWFVFKENFDKRIALGMVAIVGGAALLGWPVHGATVSGSGIDSLLPTAAVLSACLFWALDNNFTRKVALADASWIAGLKGLSAGATNLILAFALGAALPAGKTLALAMVVGFFAYGVSLTLFVIALRHLGTARAGAYFSTAPFVGAALSIIFLGDVISWQLGLAATLMGFGIWLHLTEHHAHLHQHMPLVHLHEHSHAEPDEHHSHGHTPAFSGSHNHAHTHEALSHSHAHFPDAHHRHEH